MDRIETFIGQEIYEWSFSKQAQNDMVGLAKIAAAMLGTTGFVNGLACTQTTVPSMQVSIGQGELYQMASLEASVCGTLPADTTDQILKQGILLGTATPYNLPASSTFAAPGTVGQSINYLIEAQYQDQDVSIDPTTGTTPVVLNFYNSSNPATPWSGPNNSGASSNTFRKGVIAFTVKAGTAATTGTQTTPAPDSGYIGLYVVTVAYGASSITNSNISVYPGAPILPANGILAGGFQNEYFNAAVAGGTSDAITAVFTPAPTSLTANGGVPSFMVRIATANLTTTPTFTPNSGVITPYTIVKGNNLPLALGDLAGAGHWAYFQFDTTLTKWVLLNPATGVTASAVKQIQSLTASVASNTLTVNLAATSLDFRNATLTNGAPNAAVAVGALSITVPSTATLGTVSAQQARLVLLVAYNAGTPVLCIANLAGGVNLDETTLISPTTISSGATSAGVIYSASAVSANSPFRVVGFVDVTEATAGTWATAPSTVQGVGGQALAALSSFGYGQTDQDVTASRAFGTTYYNTTGKTIFVCVQGGFTGATCSLALTVNGVVVSKRAVTTAASGDWAQVFWPVRPGSSYSAAGSNVSNSIWSELR